MRAIDSDALIKQMRADAEQIEDPVARIFYSAAISDVEHAPTIEPERKTDEKLKKITSLVEGTIDHFDLDDAMDLLYQIKDVLI